MTWKILLILAVVSVAVWLFFLYNPQKFKDETTLTFDGSGFTTAAIAKSHSETDFDISYKIKTTAKSGLLLLAQADDNDYVTSYIKGGYIVFEYDLGSGNLFMISNTRIDDNEWHTVRLKRKNKFGELFIDGVLEKSGVSGGNMIGLSTLSILFIGGTSIIPIPNVPQKAFIGCLRNLTVNDVLLKSFDFSNGGVHTRGCHQHSQSTSLSLN